jgi:hypothetical protein
MKANTRLESGAALLRFLPSLAILLLSGSVSRAAGDSDFPSRHAPVEPTSMVDLGGAGHFVILSESGITDVPASAVTGNVGVSPITGAADLLSCAEVTGKIYSVDNAGPPPCSIKAPKKLNNAVNDMQAAYTDAAGRTATIINKGGGNIGGLTLGPGVYSWNTDVNMASNVTIKGGSHGVWIFQIAKNLADRRYGDAWNDLAI